VFTVVLKCGPILLFVLENVGTIELGMTESDKGCSGTNSNTWILPKRVSSVMSYAQLPTLVTGKGAKL
jgi:hypothetical protein